LGVLDKIAADPIVRWKEWPKNPQALSGKLSRNKAGVIALLRASNYGWSDEDWRAFFDERAGIAEFDGGLSRAEAEAQAFACCVAEWLNHHPVLSPPGRCLACGGGEQAHDPLVRHGIEPTKHAWLHLRCWTDWHGAREAEARTALAKVGITAPVAISPAEGDIGPAAMIFRWSVLVNSIPSRL
jgi:hypothetical protein